MVMQFIGEGFLYAGVILGLGGLLAYKAFGKLEKSNPAITNAAKQAATQKALGLIGRLLK